MTNAKRKVKFVALGKLRQLEVMKDEAAAVASE